MKIEDVLAPWERGLGENFRLERWQNATFFWQGALRRAVVALVCSAMWNQIVIRFEGDDAAWWLSIRAGDDDPFETGVQMINWSLSHSVDIGQEAQQAVETGRLCRLVWWFEETHSRYFSATVHCDGCVFLRCYQINDEIYPFYGDKCFTFLGSTAALNLIQLRLLLILKSRTLPPCWFAGEEFKQWPGNKQTAFFFGFSGGRYYRFSRQKARDLMALIMRAAAPNLKSWGLSYNPKQQQVESEPDGIALRFWGEIVLFYGPLPLQKTAFCNPAACEFANDFLLLECETQHISAHEILEARLELLDWMQKHLPAEKQRQAMEFLS